MSAEGRARFDRFPDVIADDLFAHNLFGRDERQTPATDPAVVEAPRSLQSLLRRRIRVYVGNMQVAGNPALAGLPGAHDRGTAWWRVVLAPPALAPAAVPYVAVNGLAKLRARRLTRRAGPVAWAGTRPPGPRPGRRRERRRLTPAATAPTASVRCATAPRSGAAPGRGGATPPAGPPGPAGCASAGPPG